MRNTEAMGSGARTRNSGMENQRSKMRGLTNGLARETAARPASTNHRPRFAHCTAFI